MLTGEKISEFEGHEDEVLCILKVNIRVLASGGLDRRLIFWDTCSGSAELVLDMGDEVNCLQRVNEHQLGVLSGRRTFWLWDVEHSQVVFQLQFACYLTCFLVLGDTLLLSTVEETLQAHSLKLVLKQKTTPLCTGTELVGWVRKMAVVGQWLIVMTDCKSLFVFTYPGRTLVISRFVRSPRGVPREGHLLRDRRQHGLCRLPPAHYSHLGH
jgi:hypothetical protein